MENQSIQAKQHYLRQNIIDAGYDAEDFVQYCSTQHNLLDLADWTINKLKEVVQLYINMKTQSKNSHQTITSNKNNQDNEWCNFQQAPSVGNKQSKQEIKKQHDPSHNVTKTGQLVFSQDDWAIFLGTSPINTSQPNQSNLKIENKQIQTVQSNNKKNQQVKSSSIKSKQMMKKDQKNKKLGQIQKDPFQNLQKQIPLSPPSQQTNKKQIPIKTLIQQGSIKNQNRGPINLTNIKLQTNKIKQLPKLPQINDIIITKTEQVSRNFLQSDYTLYYIHFTPGNHVVQRKFTDFRKLRSILHGMYPHIRLPYLQPQGWLTSSQGKDSETLAKYKWMILDFLKYIILRNQQLKNCPLVRKFCGFSTDSKGAQNIQQVSKQQLKKVIQSYQNYPKPKYIGELCLSNNFIVLPPSNDGQKIISNTTNLLEQIDYEYEKLKKKFDSLFYYYDCLGKAMNDVSGSFEILQNLIKKYNFDNDQPKQLRVYEGIREMCNKMQNSMNEQCIIFKSRVKNILRFEKDNMMTLKQLIESRNKIHSQYARQNYPHLSKNGQSGIGQVEIQSKISLDDPVRGNKNNLCVQQIFWSHYTKQQINSYFEQLRKKINEQLTMISYEQLDNENDNLNFWNSMIKKCVV